MKTLRPILAFALILVLFSVAPVAFGGCSAGQIQDTNAMAERNVAEQQDSLEKEAPPVQDSNAEAEQSVVEQQDDLEHQAQPQQDTNAVAGVAESTDQEIAGLFANQQSDVYVTGIGTVTRILSDDTDGDRHQRFILRLASGQTLLVAHNIDIAPRVAPLEVGNEVHFAGIYEYNNEGGVIHWTHHDPAGNHISGYINVGGRDYR